MRDRSTLRWKTLVITTATVVLAGVSMGASAAGAATPTVTVTPNTGLADTQSVTVTGSALGANAADLAVECTSGAVDINSCDFSTFQPAFADASGAVSFPFSVRRLIAANGSTVDCAVSATCEIGVASDASAIIASAMLSFDPKIPPVLPKVKVVPATQLRDHELVAVSGSGFSAGSPIDLEECLASNPLDCATETDRFVVASATGTFATKTFAVEREFQVFDQNTGPRTVDCATSATTCVLSAGGGLGGGVPSTASLQFDRSVPPVIARIRTSPASGLVDLQNLTVIGTGFLPGGTVSVEQCAGETDICGFAGVNVTAGFTGGFTMTYSARRLVSELTFSGLHVADCASSAVTCEMVAGNIEGGVQVVGPAITFQRTKRPIAASLFALPNRRLHDNQRVGVALRGFSAYQPVTVIECAAAALTAQDSSYCDPNTQVTTITPAIGGTPNVAFFVKRTLAIADGLLDCGARAGTCILMATTNGIAGSGVFISTVTNGLAAASKHPSMRAAASIATNLNPQTHHGASRSTTPGVASAPLSFDR